MQVILDSSFAHPGSAPIWGGKKGEFRDWTSKAAALINPNRACQLGFDFPVHVVALYAISRPSSLFDSINTHSL